MEIREKIQYIRLDQKKTKTDFAKELNVAQSTISRYEDTDRQPDYSFLKSLFTKYNVNPNWIFFDIHPIYLDTDIHKIATQSDELMKEIKLFLTPEEFTSKLREILSDNVIDKIITDNDQEKSIIRKFLETIKLEGHIPFRPLLFLYYILRYVKDNDSELDEITSYKDYLLNLVERYNVISFKNNPAFTSQIKKQFEASIEVNLSEQECKQLITNYEQAIKKIESKMTSIMVIAHRKIDTKTLFPK